MREKWSSSLMKRREYLDEQIHSLIDKPGNEHAEKSAATSGCFDQFVIQDQSLVVCCINLNFIIGFHLIVREMCLNLAWAFVGFLRIAF